MADQHVDVLIIGAGISGIGAACHLRRDRPGTSFAILERRSAIGGTWDLFRYPGIRSDSDMFTFGYNFRPWRGTKILADGTSIREYVAATAAEYGVDDEIHYGRRVTHARWSSADARWTVEAAREDGSGTETWTAGFVVAGTGYYDYDRGYRPEFADESEFGGRIVHPQHWPDDLDCTGKRVVIIGSGATAVTLVPAVAETAAHVTMLQRTPSYVLSLPAVDKISIAMRRVLPESVVYRVTRARNIGLQRALYVLARARPNLFRAIVRRGAQRALRGSSDLANFTPDYDPWDQRLCIIPDNDLFEAIRGGRADVVTDRIRRFTPTGIDLESGEHLDADVVVVATGLTVQVLGGATLEVDGDPVDVPRRATYKGVLIEGVPNFAMVFGYINASWTLKADLAAEYVCRLLEHMDQHGYAEVVAHAEDADRADGSILGALNSGYVRRGDAVLPRQGTSGPWKVHNDYLHDAPMLRHATIDDGVARFRRTSTAAPATRSEATA